MCADRASQFIISAFKNFMAGSLASLPALRVLLNLELVLNLTQKACSECSPHAEGIQAGEADIPKARKPEPSEWYKRGAGRAQGPSPGASRCLFKQAFRQLCPCFLSCRRDRPSLPVCDVLPARPQDHTPESPGYTYFTYCLHLISRVFKQIT